MKDGEQRAAIKAVLYGLGYMLFGIGEKLLALPNSGTRPSAEAITTSIAVLLFPFFAIVADTFLLVDLFSYLTGRAASASGTDAILFSSGLVMLECVISLSLAHGQQASPEGKTRGGDPVQWKALIVAVLSIQLLAAGSRIAAAPGDTSLLLITLLLAIGALATHYAVLRLVGPAVLTIVHWRQGAHLDRRRRELEERRLTTSRRLIETFEEWHAATRDLDDLDDPSLQLAPLVAHELNALLGQTRERLQNELDMPGPPPAGPQPPPEPPDNPYPQYDPRDDQTL